MNTETNEYLLLFRGQAWDDGLSREQLERAMNDVMAWFNGLRERGISKAGQPLAPAGRVVGRTKSNAIADGPFIESKESVAGYLIVMADSFEAALAIAKACPTLAFGATVEVRPILEDCPTFKRVRERLAFADA